MGDQFQGYSRAPGAPPRRAVAVAPNDNTPLADIPTSLYVGTAGNVTGRLVDSNADTVWKNVAAGSYLLGQFKFIKATGTTAADILAQYE